MEIALLKVQIDFFIGLRNTGTHCFLKIAQIIGKKWRCL